MPTKEQHLFTIHSSNQKELEASERRFRSLVRYGSDLIIIIDNSGNYLYVTDPEKHVLGYTASYFIGKNVINFLHPDDGPGILSAMKKLAPNEYIELPHYRFKAANEEWRWLESKMTNFTDDPAIGGLVVNSRDVTDKKRLEAERRNETEKKHRQITRAIVKAQEMERHAIGNELHDNVNQLLTTVKLYLLMSRENAEMQENLLPKAIGYIQDCIDEIRRLTNRLVSPHHPDLKLSEAIRDLINSIALTGVLQLNYQPVNIDDAEVSEDVQLAVYRIMQEQLTNIIRHAGASVVDISLFFEKDKLILAITDNGQGFDIKQIKKGLGMANMYNRALTINGNLDITSSPGEGCTLTGSFPAL